MLGRSAKNTPTMIKILSSQLSLLYLLLCLSSCNETESNHSPQESAKEQNENESSTEEKLTQPNKVIAKKPTESKIVIELNPDKPMPSAEELAEQMFKPMSKEEIQRAAKKIMESSQWKEVKESK
jgi:hypothetical protein